MFYQFFNIILEIVIADHVMCDYNFRKEIKILVNLCFRFPSSYTLSESRYNLDI